MFTFYICLWGIRRDVSADCPPGEAGHGADFVDGVAGDVELDDDLRVVDEGDAADAFITQDVSGGFCFSHAADVAAVDEPDGGAVCAAVFADPDEVRGGEWFGSIDGVDDWESCREVVTHFSPGVAR